MFSDLGERSNQKWDFFIFFIFSFLASSDQEKQHTPRLVPSSRSIAVLYNLNA